MNCGDPTGNLSSLNEMFVSRLPSPKCGTSVTIKCEVGFKWADNSMSYLLSCQANGMWIFAVACLSRVFKSLEIFPDFCYACM